MQCIFSIQKISRANCDIESTHSDTIDTYSETYYSDLSKVKNLTKSKQHENCIM